MIAIDILPPVNRDVALRLGESIYAIVDQIVGHEVKLSRSYARLGNLMREVKKTQSWVVLGYDRFSRFMEDIRKRIGRERSQLYAILTVSETLSPYISEDLLEKIGIARARELRRFVKEGGNLGAEIYDPDDQSETDDLPNLVQLMDYAARPKVTAAMLRVRVNDILHVKEGPRGNWVEWGGGYLTTDERREVDEFWATGRQMFQVPDETPEHTWKTQVFLAAVRECLGSWSAEVQ